MKADGQQGAYPPNEGSPIQKTNEPFVVDAPLDIHPHRRFANPVGLFSNPIATVIISYHPIPPPRRPPATSHLTPPSDGSVPKDHNHSVPFRHFRQIRLIYMYDEPFPSRRPDILAAEFHEYS
jgi:hypothetical protein